VTFTSAVISDRSSQQRWIVALLSMAGESV
jgi:hypothetical protein